jgi:formylglycine-generating enzyme required for sulfatase activity
VLDTTTSPEEGLAKLAWEQAAEDADLTLRLPGGIPMFFRLIPATGPEGFRMGARGFGGESEPTHRVILTELYYMALFPVTQQQFTAWTNSWDYAAFCDHESMKEGHRNAFKGRPLNPAEQITWREATGYCEWLSGLLERKGQRFRAMLPTEAQWEYTCRAGTDTDYSFGDGVSSLNAHAWHGAQFREGATHPAGCKLPNNLGLHDMHGNVWEWCRDAWDPDAYRKRVSPVFDPVNESPDTQGERVLRGGTWCRPAAFARSSYRAGEDPTLRLWSYGFRVACVPI